MQTDIGRASTLTQHLSRWDRRWIMPFVSLLVVIIVIFGAVFQTSAQTVNISVTHSGFNGGRNFAVGTNGTVTFNVVNSDPVNPVDVSLDISLPSELTFVSASLSTFACAPIGSNVVCNNAALGGGASETFTLTLTPTADNTDLGFNITPTINTVAEAPVSHGPFDIVATPVIDLEASITHTGNAGVDFIINTNTGVMNITITNIGNVKSTAPSAIISLGGGLSLINGTVNTIPAGLATCTGSGSFVSCTYSDGVDTGTPVSLTFNVQAPGVTAPSPQNNIVTLSVANDSNLANHANVTDPNFFAVVAAAAPSATLTFPPLPTSTPFPQIGQGTFGPNVTVVQPTPSRTFIPPPPTRTPPPRPANAGQAITIPPTGVDIVVNRDGVNVRLLPAIGADVIAFVNAGTTFEAVTGRSGDNEWLRIMLGGEEGWIGVPVITVLAGDINSLPVADPRTIPYGGWENPRAGITSATSQWIGRLANSGLRLRGGPGLGYPILANPPRYTEFPLLGRTSNNRWLQVNFEGTLGWVASEFVELPFPGLEILNQLPIDGIVADGVPISEPTSDSYIDVLKLMLARLELAQPSLDEIRAIWTSVSLGNAAQCGSFPARPSDINIATALLAAFNGTLGPLEADFNNAMAHLRRAIDLLIESCGFAQPTEGLVGEGAVAVALQAVNEADALFSSLRGRLNELIPADRVPTEYECLFTYNSNGEIVTRLLVGNPAIVSLDPRNFVLGFCFDGAVGETYRLEALKLNGNMLPLISVSSFNNPTNFIAVGRIEAGASYTALNNILIPETGQYLVILSDLTDTVRDVPLNGDIALLLTNTTGRVGILEAGLAIDAVTGQLVVNQDVGVIVPTSVAPPAFSTPVIDGDGQAVQCPNLTYVCTQFSSCEQALACLQLGNVGLDPDRDGIPCEETICAAIAGPPPP